MTTLHEALEALIQERADLAGWLEARDKEIAVLQVLLGRFGSSEMYQQGAGEIPGVVLADVTFTHARVATPAGYAVAAAQDVDGDASIRKDEDPAPGESFTPVERGATIPVDDPPQEPAFYCEHCSMRWANERDCRQHEAVCDGKAEPAEEKPMVKCPDCGHEFRSNAGLASHRRSLHPEPVADGRARCHACELAFGSLVELGAHCRDEHGARSATAAMAERAEQLPGGVVLRCAEDECGFTTGRAVLMHTHCRVEHKRRALPSERTPSTL